MRIIRLGFRNIMGSCIVFALEDCHGQFPSPPHRFHTSDAAWRSVDDNMATLVLHRGVFFRPTMIVLTLSLTSIPSSPVSVPHARAMIS